jgi:hypothetical protein
MERDCLRGKEFDLGKGGVFKVLRTIYIIEGRDKIIYWSSNQSVPIMGIFTIVDGGLAG